MVLHPANGNHTATLALEKQKGLASTYTLTPRLSWLPDLGSNQGPTD